MLSAIAYVLYAGFVFVVFILEFHCVWPIKSPSGKKTFAADDI